MSAMGGIGLYDACVGGQSRINRVEQTYAQNGAGMERKQRNGNKE